MTDGNNEAPKATLLQVVDFPSTTPTRAGRMDVLVFYRVGQNVPQSITIPKEDLNEERIKEAIKTEEAKRAALTGKEISLA